METTEKIRRAGLKMTPQRKAVYETMMELKHAPIDRIITGVHERNPNITVSTVYRILDSFLEAGVFSRINHPESGKCYFDITPGTHHHIFREREISDYDDPELTRLIREHLKGKLSEHTEVDKISVHITVTTPKT